MRTSCQHASACRSSQATCPARRTRKCAGSCGGGEARNCTREVPKVSSSCGCTQSSQRSTPSEQWASKKSRRAASNPQWNEPVAPDA
eukprot:scaffold260986_cov27-Tisochrysis_lutea.AAC.1